MEGGLKTDFAKSEIHSPATPFEVLDVFSRKSISMPPGTFIFIGKQVPIEVKKRLNFDADISNHF